MADEAPNLGDGEVETESSRQQAARHFEALRRHCLSADRGPKHMEDRINTGKWEHAKFEIRKIILDGEQQPRWCCIEWYKDPELFPELGPLPYAFYIHEEKSCTGDALRPDAFCTDPLVCGYRGITPCVTCPRCGSTLSEPQFCELDGRFIDNVHKNYNPSNPFSGWKRIQAAREAKNAHMKDLRGKRRERSRESRDRFIHALGHEEKMLTRLRRPMISVPDRPLIIVPGSGK